MKKFLIIILISLFSAFNVNANQVEIKDETIKSGECYNVIKNNIFTNDLNKNNNLEYFFKKEYRQKFIPCFKQIEGGDLSLKILRMIYGEVVTTAVSISSAVTFNLLFENEQNVNYKFDIEKFNKGTDILSYIPNIIGVLNYLVFSIAVFLVAAIYGSTFFKMMSSKNQLTTQYLGKNTLRIIIGLSSIFPLSFINNFTFIQFIFICILIVGAILAKILWLLMLLSINITYMKSDFLNTFDNQDIIIAFNEQINSNIDIHYCDIQKRNSILEKEVLSDSYTELESSSYYKCLIEPKAFGFLNKNISQEELSKIIIPEQLQIGEFCAKKFQYMEESEEYCGHLFVDSSYSDENIKEIKEIAQNIFALESENHQAKIRNIANLYYKFDCKESGGDQEEEAKKPFKCPKIKSDGSIEYNKELNKIVFENEKFKNQIDKDNFIKNNIYVEMLKIKSDIEDSKIKLSKNEQILSKNVDATEDLIKVYEKGFLMAGNIFYERARIDQTVKNNLYSIKDIYSIKTTQEFDLPNINIISEEKNTGLLFPINQLLNSEKNKNCALNYSECNKSAINPFTNLMDNGNQILDNSIGYVLTITAIKTALQTDILKFLIQNTHLNKQVKAQEKRKIEENRSGLHKNMIEYIDFIATIIFIYVFIGVFFAFVLPFIPFFLFSSLVFSWFVQSFKILTVSGLLSLYMLLPNEKNESFIGKEEKIYKLFIKSALTPILILCGFLITIILSNLGISILNIWFAIIVDYFNLKGTPENIMDYINIGIALGIYLFMVTKIVIKSSESIAEFPIAVSKWLDIDIEDERVFNKVKGLFESYIVPSISRFIK